MALSATIQRSSVARPTVASRRSAVVVKASAESRRAVLGSFLAGAVVTLAGSAKAVTPVDIFDDRKARTTGYDLIYEARDLDLPQAARDGFTQARTDLEATKKAVKEAEKRIDSLIAPSIEKKYWTEAREEMRRQVGTLRFDLNTLAQTKPKEAKKAALALKKEFIANVEALDFALRQKDQASATAKLASVKTSLDAVLAAVL